MSYTSTAHTPSDFEIAAFLRSSFDGQPTLRKANEQRPKNWRSLHTMQAQDRTT